MNIQRVTPAEVDQRLIEQVSLLSQRCLPQDTVPEEAFFRELLEEPTNLNIIAQKEGTVIGFVAIMKQSVAATDEDIRKYDPDMSVSDADYYAMVIEIDQQYRKTGLLLHLILRTAEELLRDRHNVVISQHVRCDTGIEHQIRKTFPQRKELRTLQNWLGTKESFAYITIKWSQEDITNIKKNLRDLPN